MECGHADGAPLSDGTLVCLLCFVTDLASQDMVSLKCHALAQLRDAWSQDAEFKRAALASQHCQLILGRLLEDLCNCCDDTLTEELCRVISVLVLHDSCQSRAPQGHQLLEYFLEGTAFMAVEHKGPGVARLLAFLGSIAPRIFGQGVSQGQALVGAVLSILSAERSVQSQGRGSEHLVPCLNVLLGALEVPELEPCISSSGASDVILACFEVAASKKEADLLLALRFLGHLAKRGSLPLDSLCHAEEWAGRLPGEGSLRQGSNTGTSQHPFFEVLRGALLCTSEEVQLYALNLFSAALSTSASSPASFLERALHCGLSVYLIEAMRSAARGQKAQSAEVLLGSLQCLLALADAPDFGLRLAVGLDTLVSVLASSVDSGLTPAFILCATVLERAFAQHEPASMTEAQLERLLRLLFWGVERHHGYVSAQGDRATFRACFVASACALQELLKWHATILPLTPGNAQCIQQSLVVACQALSSSEAQVPDSELLTSALKLVSAVHDVALSTRYPVAQRSTEGVVGDLYSCLPEVVEQSIAPLLASLGFSPEHAALTSACSRVIAQFLRCHDQQQGLAKKLAASGFVPWVLKGLEAAHPGESAHAPLVEMVVIASARSIQLPETDVAGLLDPSQISQLPQGFLGTLDVLGSCGSQALGRRQSGRAPSQGALRAAALIIHAASTHNDYQWDSILGEEYRGFLAAAVSSYVRGTCWDEEPVWSILLAASLLALASGGSPHQEPAALPWRGTLTPEQTPQQTLCAALERVSGAVHFPLQSWPLALPVWILYQDRLQRLFELLVQGWICDCYCAQASEEGQGSDSAVIEESPVQPLVRLLEHPDLQIPSRVAGAIKGHIEGALGPGACANAVEILLGLAKLAAHSCSTSLALQQLGVVACLQKAALLHVSSMEARKLLAFLSLVEALLTPWSRAAPVDEAAAFLGEVTPLVSTMVQQMSLTLRGTEGSSPEPGLLLGMLNTVNLTLAVGLAQAASTGLQYGGGMPVRSSLTMLADTILRSFLSSKLGEAVSGELLPRLMAKEDVSHGLAEPLPDAGAACPSADSPALAVAAASFLLLWLLQQAQQAHRDMPAETAGPPSLETVIHWATKVLSSPSHMDTLDEDQCSPLPCVAAQVLLAALLRISPIPCTKPMGTGWQIEPQLPPSTVTCLLFGFHSAACSGNLRIRNTALLAICVVISWGSDESYVLACSPWTQYLFETERFWGEPPANEEGETPGTTPPGWGHNQGKGPVRRCLASLVASMSRHGMGLLVPHVVSQLKKKLGSHSRAPSGMRFNGGALGFASSDSQALSEDQEDATRITISKHHGAVAVVECGLLEWLAFMHADGDAPGLRAED